MKNILYAIFGSIIILTRILAFAVKVAVAVSIAFLLISLFSCNSSKSVITETAATESMSAIETAKDSVGSSLDMQTSASGYLDISDLKILFYPPVQAEISDSMATPKTMTTSKTPVPALITIGRISAGSSADTALKASSDSVGTRTSDLKHDQSTTDSEKRIRDPTKPSWPVTLTLFLALLIIIYTGFMLYRSNRL